MPRFQFAVVDSSGQVKQGTTEAATEAEAVARIERRGLKLQSISAEVPAAAGEPAFNGDPPLHHAQALPSTSPPIPPVDRADTGHDRPSTPSQRQHGRAAGPWIIASVALAVSVAALAVVLLRNPLGRGVGGYDFSTPKAALESQIKIEANHDILALLEMSEGPRSAEQREKLATMEIRNEAEFRGKKILFVAYKADGISKYEVDALEKDARTGFWFPGRFSSFDAEKENKALAEQVSRWELSGNLGDGK